MSDVQPWQVWIVDLGEPVGSEQGGIRPVVVIASQFHCQFPIDLTMAMPLTTRNRGLTHHVTISSPESGLKYPSWAMTEQIVTISTKRFTGPQPIGRLSDTEQAEASRWLHRMLASR